MYKFGLVARIFVYRELSYLLVIYRVFIKYCVFFQDFEIYSRLCVSVCTLDFTLGPPDGRSNTSAAAELAEFRKVTTF